LRKCAFVLSVHSWCVLKTRTGVSKNLPFYKAMSLKELPLLAVSPIIYGYRRRQAQRSRGKEPSTPLHVEVQDKLHSLGLVFHKLQGAPENGRTVGLRSRAPASPVAGPSDNVPPYDLPPLADPPLTADPPNDALDPRYLAPSTIGDLPQDQRNIVAILIILIFVLSLAAFIGGYLYPIIKAIMCGGAPNLVMAVFIVVFPPAGFIYLFMDCISASSADITPAVS
jgi:hypothetical protein